MKPSCCKKNCPESTSQVLDNKALIMFIGLSAKPETEDLSPTTNTGKLISAIEERIAERLGVYKTNAVKYAPLDSDGKLRYPTISELKECLPCLLTEIETVSPRVIVPLGGVVSRFLLQSLQAEKDFSGFESGFHYETYPLALGHAMPIHHPSYIWIYKRKRLNEYVERVADQLTELAVA